MIVTRLERCTLDARGCELPGGCVSVTDHPTKNAQVRLVGGGPGRAPAIHCGHCGYIWDRPGGILKFVDVTCSGTETIWVSQNDRSVVLHRCHDFGQPVAEAMEEYLLSLRGATV